MARPKTYLTDHARLAARTSAQRVRRIQARQDAPRYLREATLALCTPDPKLRLYVALIIWRAAARGYTPARIALNNPKIAASVAHMFVRIWKRQTLGWCAQVPVPSSLAESETPELRRVAHLVDQESVSPSNPR